MSRPPAASPQTRLVLDLLAAEPTMWHYGYDLGRRAGLKSGTLYPILVRLAERGWLETRWTHPERPGRPPRHIYRLTALGAEGAAASLEGLQPARILTRVAEAHP